MSSYDRLTCSCFIIEDELDLMHKIFWLTCCINKYCNKHIHVLIKSVHIFMGYEGGLGAGLCWLGYPICTALGGGSVLEIPKVEGFSPLTLVVPTNLFLGEFMEILHCV